MKRYLVLFALLVPVAHLAAQQNDTIKKLETVTIGAKRSEGLTRMSGAINGTHIWQDELFRAACCNLGESFVSNASTDVNYNDAAVGARQIKLLGLSGQYVQMLTEGLPMANGAAMPYLLAQVPGAWMQSIAVSKGTSSVKQGYQSVTGQIDVEYLKPDRERSVMLNLYGDSRLRAEANAAANIYLGDHLSTELLAHVDKDFGHHDDNDDGWHDSPAVRQVNLQNRWKYMKGRYIMHAGVGLLDESREGGQLLKASTNPYRVLVDNRRYEGYMKHALLLNREHNTNVALLANGYLNSLDGTFGNKLYDNDQRAYNAQLVLEHDFSAEHSLSAGLSLTGDHTEESGLTPSPTTTDETVGGIYAQYTYKPTWRLTVMAGLRGDHSSLHGNFATPRLHAKWVATDWLTLRATSGKGYRSARPLAENHYLLASGRALSIASDMPMEEAWNNGISAVANIPVGTRKLTVSAEYYYTYFLHQAVVDYDSDPMKISIADLDGRSFSHTAQVDATYTFSEQLEATAAFRYNKVMCTYGGELKEKPLQSRYKGLLTMSWKPMMALWQVDVTLQLNGGGRMPDPHNTGLWDKEFPAYPQLNMQVTREFRHFSVYVGGENLTNYQQPNPIINAADPWSTTFEPTMIWGPVHGIMGYAGIRMKI